VVAATPVGRRGPQADAYDANEVGHHLLRHRPSLARRCPRARRRAHGKLSECYDFDETAQSARARGSRTTSFSNARHVSSGRGATQNSVQSTGGRKSGEKGSRTVM
jgi:hypothetical protein